MSPSRRQLLRAISGALVATPLAGCGAWRIGGSQPSVTVSAARLPDGGPGAVAFDPHGRILWQRRLPARCHGGCPTPDGAGVVLFERRPGWRAHVLDLHTGESLAQLPLAKQEHFYGHGVFSPAGDRLYATVNHYGTGTGRVAVYDARNGYRRLGHIDLNGIGPHEIVLNPVDDTLVVALGGIETHPDYPRLKLNVDTMDPALVVIDRHNGALIARHRPSHHQLSCRHLAVSPAGRVWVGYQYQGPSHHQPPLMARLAGNQMLEVALPETIQSGLDNYIASVAICPLTGQVAMTAPRGGTTLILDDRAAELLRTVSIPDCAGVHGAPAGGFLLTSGEGAMVRLHPDGRSEALTTAPFRWDNHLIA